MWDTYKTSIEYINVYIWIKRYGDNVSDKDFNIISLLPL